MGLMQIDRPDLKDPPFYPATPPLLRNARSSAEIFNAIRQQDILLHHPFDSFRPMVELIEAAAEDPDVLAIKQTLYRVGGNSPIVEALLQAREQDKQVAVLVELKARFDEENNIDWARALERAGVHVVYGLVGLKTHCQDRADRAPRGRRPAPLRAPGHRQLQRRDGAPLHRPGPADLPTPRSAPTPPTCSTS